MRNSVRKELYLTTCSILSGLLVWIAIVSLTGHTEAWDSSAYFFVGLPILCIVSGLLARESPGRLWRWAALPLVAQYFWMLGYGEGPGNLWPLSLIFMFVLSLPLWAAAVIGANSARKPDTNTSD